MTFVNMGIFNVAIKRNIGYEMKMALFFAPFHIPWGRVELLLIICWRNAIEF